MKLIKNERPRQAIYGKKSDPLVIGKDIKIEAYTFDDGTSVITLKGMLQALGMSVSGARGQNSGLRKLVELCTSKSLKPFIGPDVLDCAKSPIPFIPPHGGKLAHGYEATLLIDLANAFLEARRAGALRKQQLHIAERSEILVAAFSKVGILAALHEKHGYQQHRAKDALQKYLEQYVHPKPSDWLKRFINNYFQQIYRLMGWSHRDWREARRPQVVGLLTDQLIYQHMPHGVRESVRKLNPMDHKGNRKFKHHQFLTEEGLALLRDQIVKVVTLMEDSPNWGRFKVRFNRMFSNKPIQMELDFMDEVIDLEWDEAAR